MTPELQARVEIDKLPIGAGWSVQPRDGVDLTAAQGVAICEFPLTKAHGFANYLLYVEGAAVGVVEAKRTGIPLKLYEGEVGQRAGGGEQATWIQSGCEDESEEQRADRAPATSRQILREPVNWLSARGWVISRFSSCRCMRGWPGSPGGADLTLQAVNVRIGYGVVALTISSCTAVP